MCIGEKLESTASSVYLIHKVTLQIALPWELGILTRLYKTNIRKTVYGVAEEVNIFVLYDEIAVHRVDGTETIHHEPFIV